jgi:uroporphyrin-3 C-methyltransferase
MNDTEQEPAVAPVPDQAPEAEVPATEDRPSRGGMGQKLVALVALLALLGTAGVLVAGYRYWQQLTGFEQRIDALAQEAGQQQDALQKRLDGMAQELEVRKQAEQQQQAMLEELQQVVTAKAEHAGAASVGAAAEAEYLIRIANRRLQLEGDVATAQFALQEADRRLQESGDPRWVAVREQLAAELVALRAVPVVDVTGASLRLSALLNTVATLKPLASEPERQQQAAAGPGREARTWETMLRDLSEKLRSMLVIRRNDRPVAPLLAPDQIYFLKQNLQLQLEVARLALLRRDQELFNQSLEHADNWLAEYFDLNQDKIQGLRQEIASLRQLVLRPPLPDLSGSLRALEAQRRSGGGTATP